MFKYSYSNLNKKYRGVSRIPSNICDGVFCKKQLTAEAATGGVL